MSHVSVSSGGWEDVPPACPADVFEHAVRVFKRTLLHHADRDPVDDDDLARLTVRLLITVLAEGGRPDEAAAVGAGYAEATGLDVVITAAGGDR